MFNLLTMKKSNYHLNEMATNVARYYVKSYLLKKHPKKKKTKPTNQAKCPNLSKLRRKTESTLMQMTSKGNNQERCS